MPRKPRLYMPDQPQHVVVRGHNRDPILIRDDDFRFLYRCLRDASSKNKLAIHAWVFMRNHLHLLVTPGDVYSLPRTMQSIGRRYVQYFNRTYHRSGALWEGRYKCSLVDTDCYLLSCYRYIELNPVRAGIVKQAEDYVYSSYTANACGKEDSMVMPHRVFLEFVAGDVFENVSESIKTDSDTGVLVDGSRYKNLCMEMLDHKTLTDIRRGTEKGLGIGQADFLLKVARLSQR